MGEDFEEQESVEDVVKRGDYRDSLIALRDYVAHELEGNRCNQCFMSKLRTGDTAALVLRLKTLLDDIQELGDPKAEGVVDQLDQIRQRKAVRASDIRTGAGNDQ